MVSLSRAIGAIMSSSRTGLKAKSILNRKISRVNNIHSKLIKSPHLSVVVKDFALQFINNSSFHGFKFLARPHPHIHPLERITWFVAIIVALWGAATLSISTLKRFQENPTVVSMERNYKDWNTSFPSVTICPLPKYDEENLIKIINEKFPQLEDRKSVMEFLAQLSKASFGTFAEVKTRAEGIEPSTYWKVVWEIAFPFVYNVSNSDAEAYEQAKMNQVITEVGICYSYNSVATIYNDPKKWERGDWQLLTGLEVFRSSPLDGDTFTQIINMNAGYRLYILDPTEFPDISIPQIEGSNNTFKNLDLTALSIVSTKEVEELSIQQRKCRLPHESNLLTSPAYSYNMCRIECRMRECHRLCKCVPYFYRPNDNYPVCDLEGMHCLDEYSEQLIRMINPIDGQKIPCDCLQLCNEVNYIVDSDNSMAWTLGTSLKWGLTKYPKFRLKRGIIFGETDLLVAVGGIAGLFFGCSLLSLAEILYYFTLHLFWFLMKKNTIGIGMI